MIEKLKLYIMNKLDMNNECEIISKKTGEVFFVKKYSNFDGWTLYSGCDLIIGDVTLDKLVRVLLSIG